MSHAVDTRADARQADDARAFRHLLHEVASHVTGLGLTLDMLGEPGTPPEDTAAMAVTARGALDDLRHLIADVGELTRFLHRHGPVRSEGVAVADLLADLEHDGVTVRHADAASVATIRADRTVVAFILQLLVKTCRRHAGVDVTASATMAGETSVAVEISATYAAGTRRALEKAPLVVDHYCNAVASALDGTFVREQSKTGQRVGFVLPVS